MWNSVIILCFVVRYFVPILVFNHIDGEERAGCFAFLSSWCLVIVGWLFLAVPQVSLQFVIVVFPDHTHLLLIILSYSSTCLYP